MNGTHRPQLIARTGEYITYRHEQPALALIDIDTKGMSEPTGDQVREAGGFWRALVRVLPELATAGCVTRRSTSSGITRTDTNERLPGSNGIHIYVLVKDAADIERFLRTIHERCWLHGLVPPVVDSEWNVRIDGSQRNDGVDSWPGKRSP